MAESRCIGIKTDMSDFEEEMEIEIKAEQEINVKDEPEYVNIKKVALHAVKRENTGPGEMTLEVKNEIKQEFIDAEKQKGGVNIEDWNLNAEGCDFDSPLRIINNLNRTVEKPSRPVNSKTYKCHLCPFHTKHKRDLQVHFVTHQIDSGLPLFKCPECDYLAKCKSYIAKHMVSHRADSEVKMYRCEACDYETKWRGSLWKHMLAHRDNPEALDLTCEICRYKANNKRQLRVHMLVHEASFGMVIYRCDTCGYETKDNKYLEIHMMIHEGLDNVTRCDKLPQENCTASLEVDYLEGERTTKMKVVRRDENFIKVENVKVEDTILKADESMLNSFSSNINATKIDFESIEPTGGKLESAEHQTIQPQKVVRDPFTKGPFKCHQCPFQSKYKRCLQSHSLVHKRVLKTHLLTHKSWSEVEVYNCERCNFHTKYVHNLRRHRSNCPSNDL